MAAAPAARKRPPGGYTFDHSSVELYHSDGSRLAYVEREHARELGEDRCDRWRPNPGVCVRQGTEQFAWIGEVTFTTDVHFFIATDGVFEAYLDKKDVVLHDTQATDLGTLTGFTTFASTPKTTVTQTVPAGYTAVQTRMVLIGADGLIVAHGESATDTLTTFFPPLANIRVQLEGAAGGRNTEGTLTQLAFPDYSAVPSSVTLQERPMPTGLAPADNATGISPAAQQLGWTGGASPATFAIGLAAVGQPSITILTSGSSFDLAKLLPSDSRCSRRPLTSGRCGTAATWRWMTPSLPARNRTTYRQTCRG